MAARKHSDDTKFYEKQQFVIFDCSNHFITAFCSRPERHLSKLDGDTTHFKEDISGEDSDEKSDAESLPWSQRDVAADVSDDEQCLSNLFLDERTRKKIELLADMVGADTVEPGIVLAKVVSVLKDLTRKNG